MTDIRATVDLAHPPELVWRALTEHRLLCDWFMPTSFVARKDTPFQFRPIGLVGFTGHIDAEISHLDPPRRITMQWRGDSLHSQVVWELEPAGAGSRLTVEHTGFLGLNGHQRRRDLIATYSTLFGERLPATVDRLAETGSDAAVAIPRQRQGSGAAAPANAGRWRVLPAIGSAAPSPAPLPVEESEPEPPPPSPPLVVVAPPRPARGRRRRQILAVAAGVLLAVLGVTVAQSYRSNPTPTDATAEAPAAQPPLRLDPTLAFPSAGAPSATATGALTAPGSLAPPPASKAAPTSTASSSARITEGAALPSAAKLTATMTVTGGPLGKLNLASYRTTITITNPGATPTADWMVAVTVGEGQSVESVTGATYARSGSTVIFTAPDSGSPVPPHGSARVTFETSGVLATRPQGCTIDGRTCS